MKVILPSPSRNTPDVDSGTNPSLFNTYSKVILYDPYVWRKKIWITTLMKKKKKWITTLIKKEKNMNNDPYEEEKNMSNDSYEEKNIMFVLPFRVFFFWTYLNGWMFDPCWFKFKNMDWRLSCLVQVETTKLQDWSLFKISSQNIVYRRYVVHAMVI